MDTTGHNTSTRGGVFIPAELIYGSGLPSGALHTWIWLRGLAGESCLTPAFSIQELARLCGKSASTIHSHLAMLKTIGALSWRTTRKGQVIIEFGSEVGEGDGQQNSKQSEGCAQDSKFPEFGNPLSLNPLNINYSDLVKELRGERGGGKIQNSGFLDSGSREGETGGAPCGEDPATIYQSITGRQPNRAQRAAVEEQVDDLVLWRETLAHWATHGWNPGNVTGILDLYQRGGPKTCRYCGKAKASPATANTLDALDELLIELEESDDAGGEDGRR